MYTIIDTALDEQLRWPITRKLPKEKSVQPPQTGPNRPAAKPAGPAPFEPWKFPFADEGEWQLFLRLMLETLASAPKEARAIFDNALSAVTEMVNQR